MSMDQVNIEFNFKKLYVWLHQKFPRFVTITAGWIGHDISGQLSILTSVTIKGGGQRLKQIIPSSLNFLGFFEVFPKELVREVFQQKISGNKIGLLLCHSHFEFKWRYR